MQDSNLPYRIWLKAMFLMISTKKSISALEMQRQLGLKRYEPVLYMINKLRMAMGERDNKYELEGEVELDDAFVTVVKSGVEKKSPSVRGRGSLRKRSILVMVSRKTFKTKAGRKAYAPGFIKLMAMDNLDESSVLESVFASTNTSKTTIRSDAYRSFNKLKKLVRSHKPKVTPPKQAHIHLPWVHCAIGNLKRILNGIHHHINDENLQLYLNEFAYKFNRRKLSFTFDNILRAGLQMTWE
ncbi:MAG: IS1595 family transposase [Bacteroidota bacterium]